MNNTFKRNLIIGYTVSLFLLVLTAVASYISIQKLLQSFTQVNHTYEVMNKLDGILNGLSTAEAGQRGYLLTGSESYLQHYQTSLQNTFQSFDNARRLTADNPEQQKDLATLWELLDQRRSIMDGVLQSKRQTGKVSVEDLDRGLATMNRIRTVVNVIREREQVLMDKRSAAMQNFAGSTPTLIVVASLLSLLVTIVSFVRVNNDFQKRTKLQQALQQKDEEVTQRIAIIQNIAEKISAGNYKIRVDEEAEDVLGTLSGSLNKMAESLDLSFEQLSAKEWQQAGIAALNEKMLGEKNLLNLVQNVAQYLCQYTEAAAAAFYLPADDKTLELATSMGADRSLIKTRLHTGEGLAGRSVQEGRLVLMEGIEPGDIAVNYATGQLAPRSLLAMPIYHEGRLKGVLELAGLQPFPSTVKEFLGTANFNIGMAIHSARNHERLEELLAETQAQSEELQAQHSELENINSELEAQAEKLQASEEELKVQQEELQQANSELEERSRLLEEKNELILERNLEIQAKAEELELTTRYKSEFLANMSHELRTPLNSILLLSRLLSQNNGGNLTKEQTEYADVIQNSGNSLLRLIDEILDLSKIESGKMNLELSDVSLASVAKDLRQLFAPIAAEKGIGFTVEVAPDVPSSLETDRLRLDQILRNLISNALKFTKEGSVQVGISSQDGALAFRVKDTGIGIAKEKQQQVFEAFQQADGSTRRQYGGTGLGLSISRELAKLLGGEIRLKSEEGKGSEFTLLLPLHGKAGSQQPAPFVPQRPAEKPVTTLPEALSEQQFIAPLIPASLPDDRDAVAPSDKVILIIEDDTAFARSLLDFTRQQGYKAIVAVRGDEGIQLAQQFKPLGILLDIQLPVKSGWEVMEALKANPETKAIPVHMMSAHEAGNKSISKGAVDFISKPVAFEKMSEMFSRIEDALSRHPKKVLIVEEDPKHAKALAYFLETFQVNAEIQSNVHEGIQTLKRSDVDCVILDMGVQGKAGYETLEVVKQTPGLEKLPIIIFTGKNLSQTEEMRIKQYADSIVIKTAHSYQRILDEVSLFLHLVEEQKKDSRTAASKRLGSLDEILKGKTVLIADDDARNIFSLSKALEMHGLKVLSAVNGKEALVKLQKHPEVSLVLMDMMMPEMDGYESTRHIRQQLQYKNLPVIAVTAKAMTGDREKCIEAGASDYITKPVDVDQLVSLLRVWLYEGR